jgi:hypothetical protein
MLLFPQQQQHNTLTTVNSIGTPWTLQAAQKAPFSNYSSSMKSSLLNPSVLKNEDDMKIVTISSPFLLCFHSQFSLSLSANSTYRPVLNSVVYG